MNARLNPPDNFDFLIRARALEQPGRLDALVLTHFQHRLSLAALVNQQFGADRIQQWPPA